ncbi:hypothetical protein [Sphingosinicella sp.]|uniref:hypothetical protein n=1 Tax=Sphingosinicella sp. TaxID=1917971 RepID=UPI0040378F1A
MGIRRVIGAALLIPAAQAQGQLPPPVPRPPPQNCTAPEHRQLDFWVGDWNVYRTGTQSMAGTSRVERIYNDCAIRETWSPFDMNAGGSISSYDRTAGEWRQTWVDSTADRIDYGGRLTNGRFVFTARRPASRGQAERLTRVTQWPEGNTVRQTGETSTDDGRTWTPSYDYTYRPRP